MPSMAAGEPDWLTLNRANWDERVPIHLASPMYDLASLRRGARHLNAIEEAELGPVDGKRVLHLQCHFGQDSLILAGRGADLTGLDFSPAAIAAAQALARELGLAERARFVLANLYDAPGAIAGRASFDLVYATWGTICWLPDIRSWARIVAHFLEPGGSLYFAEGHPAALVFDDLAPGVDGKPGWFAPYFHAAPLVLENERDYADPTAKLSNRRTHEWIHPLGSVVTALVGAGLNLRWLHEHDGVPWPMFEQLVRGSDGLWRWPEQRWLPLGYSLLAQLPN